MRIFPIDEAPDSPAEETQAPVPEMKPTRVRRSNGRRVVIVGVAFILIIGVGFLAYRYFQISKARSAIEPLVQNVTLRTSNEIKYDIEPSKITYKELFEKIDKDLAEIESKKIDMQTIPGRFDEGGIEASLNYMKSCQGLLRALESKYYKQLAFSTAVEWQHKALDLYYSAGYYGRYYAKNTLNEAEKESNKKEVEYNGSVEDLSKAIKEMEPARTALARFLSDKVILENDLLSKLAAKNENDRTKKAK